MPAMTDTIKVEIAVAILSLLSAGENRSLFIMPEFYSGVNNSGCAFVCRIVRFSFYYLIHLHSFDGAKERSKKTPAASKNLRILLLKQKIRTRPAATNKNFHGTRFAQTPGNFYCFLSMPLNF